MTLTELINKAAQLINLASERCASGFPDQANAHLDEIKTLLDVQPAAPDTPAGETPEQNPDE